MCGHVRDDSSCSLACSDEITGSEQPVVPFGCSGHHPKRRLPVLQVARSLGSSGHAGRDDKNPALCRSSSTTSISSASSLSTQDETLVMGLACIETASGAHIRSPRMDPGRCPENLVICTSNAGHQNTGCESPPEVICCRGPLVSGLVEPSPAKVSPPTTDVSIPAVLKPEFVTPVESSKAESPPFSALLCLALSAAAETAQSESHKVRITSSAMPAKDAQLDWVRKLLAPDGKEVPRTCLADSRSIGGCQRSMLAPGHRQVWSEHRC